jgi:tyrosyl-tRNA synthetase
MSETGKKTAQTHHSQKSVDEQLAYLRKGAAEIIREEDLRAKLEQSAKTGKPLRVYLGVDPTAPDIHLGHTVVIRKLKHFQDMGHTAIFLIGDFSAMIGDPTGQSETRPPLTREQVDANAKTYLDQVFKILDRDKTEVRYNSEWLGKLTSYEIIRLCGKYPLARMLEREDFRSRLESGRKFEAMMRGLSELAKPSAAVEKPQLESGRKLEALKRGISGLAEPGTAVGKPQSIAIHELLYPLLTALDAVNLKSDVELGATEQKFNILVHRDIQREYGLSPQVVFTMPILVGLDGAKKMSKSLGNYVGITEPPNEMFGKLMSISDELMWSYYELLTDFEERVIVRLKEEVRTGVLHPMDTKMQLAHTIIASFHGESAASSARDEFQRVFRDRQAPGEISEVRMERREGALITHRGSAIQVVSGLNTKWCQLLKYLEQVGSIAEAARIIEQGGFEIDGVVVRDPAARLDPNLAATYKLKVGKKKFLRIVVE